MQDYRMIQFNILAEKGGRQHVWKSKLWWASVEWYPKCETNSFSFYQKRHWDCLQFQVVLSTSTSAAPVPGEVQSWVGAVLSLAYLPLIGLSQTFSACLYFSLPPTITSLLCLSLAMATLINPFKNEWLQSRTSPLSSQKLKSKKRYKWQHEMKETSTQKSLWNVGIDHSDLFQIMLINITNDKITLIPNFKSSTRRQINLIW